MLVRPLLQGEDDFVRGIRAGNDHVLKVLYAHCFPSVLRFITQNSGGEQEAEDIFQEAMVVLYRNVMKGMELRCQVKTYLYSVSRRLWLKELKDRKKYASRIEDMEEFIQLSVDEVDEMEKAEMQHNTVAKSLVELGEPCSELLKRFYVTGETMTQIAESFGYTNADNAKNQKYKCLQRLKRIFFERLSKEN